jgi:hypothetical protein
MLARAVPLLAAPPLRVCAPARRRRAAAAPRAPAPPRAYPGREIADDAELELARSPEPVPVYDSDDEEVQEYHVGGAIATLVFSAALLSERLNGAGVVQSLELHEQGAHPLLVATVFGLLAAAVWPDGRERAPAAGLAQRAQRAGGRIAMAALAGAISIEMVTKQGLLAWLDVVETGVEAVTDVEMIVILLGLVVLTTPPLRKGA